MSGKLILSQIFVVLLGSVIAFYVNAASFINNPLPPGLELYSHNWGYQLIMYGVFWLPFTLVLLGVALLMEYGLIALWSKLRTGKR
jgi:hypothetical protein